MYYPSINLATPLFTIICSTKIITTSYRFLFCNVKNAVLDPSTHCEQENDLASAAAEACIGCQSFLPPCSQRNSESVTCTDTSPLISFPGHTVKCASCSGVHGVGV